MYRIQTSVSTSEERVAKQLTKAISDLTLDLERVGYYIATAMPYLHFARFRQVAESADHEMSMRTDIDYEREYRKLGF
jgi:hypothetical protein